MTKVGKLRYDEEHVIKSVAKEFSGTWRPGEDPPDAYLSINGQEIAVEISTLVQTMTVNGRTQSRLSDDVPAGDLLDKLNVELQRLIPDRHRIIITLKSPILQFRKTADALTEMLCRRLRDIQSFTITERITINSNKIILARERDLKQNHKKVCGIVASTRFRNCDIMSNALHILGERISIKTKKCMKIQSTNSVWLALLNEYPVTDAQTYRDALSQISIPHRFEKILLVSRDGTVDTL